VVVGLPRVFGAWALSALANAGRSLAGVAVKTSVAVRREYGRVPRGKQGVDPCTLWAWAEYYDLDGDLAFSGDQGRSKTTPFLNVVSKLTI
jgi:hypothetical protein